MHAHRFRFLTTLIGALALSFSISCTKAGGGDDPVINHTPVSGEQPAGVAVQITAGVTDSDGVQTVAVYYQAPHAGAWTSAILSVGASANTYVGEIPATAIVAPSLSYYIEAQDKVGNSTKLPADAPNSAYTITVAGTTGDSKGPTIGHVKIADGRTMGSQVIASATVTDTTGVGSVTCYYRAQGATDFASMVMTPQGNDKYQATFPIQVIVPDAVEYYIEAIDTAPALNRSTLPMTAPAELFTFTVSAGDETPPVITHTAIADGQPEGRPVAVVARIDDLSIPLARADVMYRTHGTTTWTTLAMTESGSTGQWSAIIPASAATSAGVDYRIEAQDGAPLGNVGYAPGPTVDEFYSFTTAPESCIVPPLASESFEAGIFPGWWRTYSAATGCEWTVDDSEGHDGTHSAYHSYGAYGVNCSDLLVMPCLDLSGMSEGLVIDFYQQASSSYTGEIHTLEWAENNHDPASATYAVVGDPLPKESSSSTWAYRKVTIPPGSPMLGKAKVYFAFRYVGSYASAWYLDEIRVRQPGPAIELSHITASPNPVTSPTADVTLNVTLRNSGDGPSSALTGTLTTTDSGITINTGTAAFAGVPAGGETTSATPFHLSVAAGHADGEAPLKLTATDGTHTYNVDIKLYIGVRAEAHIVLYTTGSTWESDTEMYVGYGADPENPTWISAQIPYVSSDPDNAGTFTYDVDLSAHVAHLPPSMAEPWFLKAVNTYSYGTLDINEFSISYGASSYSALNLPFRVSGSSSGDVAGYLMVPEPPRLVVDAVATTPTTLAPGSSNVQMAITIRNLGSATQGALNGTLSLKAPTTAADVPSLSPTTAVQFATGALGTGSTATGASSWTFSVAAAHNDGSPLHFNLHLVDASSGLVWDVPVDVDVPWPGVSVVEWGGSTATYDSDGVPDPPATGEGPYGLVLVIQNTGTLATANKVTATLAINSASAGKATIPSTTMGFGNTALAAGQKIQATNAVDLTLTGAQVHDTILIDATFTDGTNTWPRTIAIPVYAHAGEDAKDSTYGSSGTHDLRFMQVNCDNTTLDVRLTGWATELAEDKQTSLVIGHPSSGAVLRLATYAGTISAYTLNAAGTGWDDATVPPSLTITPAEGSTSYLTFRVSLADITTYLGTKQVRLGAQEDSYYTPYDYLPDAWSAMSPSSLVLVTWP